MLLVLLRQLAEAVQPYRLCMTHTGKHAHTAVMSSLTCNTAPPTVWIDMPFVRFVANHRPRTTAYIQVMNQDNTGDHTGDQLGTLH